MDNVRFTDGSRLAVLKAYSRSTMDPASHCGTYTRHVVCNVGDSLVELKLRPSFADVPAEATFLGFVWTVMPEMRLGPGQSVEVGGQTTVHAQRADAFTDEVYVKQNGPPSR